MDFRSVCQGHNHVAIIIWAYGHLFTLLMYVYESLTLHAQQIPRDETILCYTINIRSKSNQNRTVIKEQNLLFFVHAKDNKQHAQLDNVK